MTDSGKPPRWWQRRRLRRTCPRCGWCGLTRIERREGVTGPLLTLTRYCVSCGYHDGVVRLLDPDHRYERDLAQYGEPYVLRD